MVNCIVGQWEFSPALWEDGNVSSGPRQRVTYPPLFTLLLSVDDPSCSGVIVSMMMILDVRACSSLQCEVDK